MAEYSSISALMKAIQKQVDDTLKNEVCVEVKDVYQRHMDTDVYLAYKPKEYIRRYGDGGLIDDKNVVGEVANGVLEVKAVAPLKDMPENYKMPTATYLAELMEYGNDDAYGEAWAKPRPFTENTIKDLRTSKQHVEAMKKGLRSRGLDIE